MKTCRLAAEVSFLISTGSMQAIIFWLPFMGIAEHPVSHADMRHILPGQAKQSCTNGVHRHRVETGHNFIHRRLTGWAAQMILSHAHSGVNNG